MQEVTEDSLTIEKQPQKLLKDFHVPIAMVADMIREATEQTEEYMKAFPEADQYDKGVNDALFSARSFFAARRHAYKNNVYVIRIHYRPSKTTRSNRKSTVLVYDVEVMDEKEYQPILPL